MAVKFQQSRDWFDARVTFQNLKMDSSLNVLSDDDRKKLWFPYMIYSNIRSEASYEKTSVREIWKVVRNEKYSFQVTHFNILYSNLLDES